MYASHALVLFVLVFRHGFQCAGAWRARSADFRAGLNMEVSAARAQSSSGGDAVDCSGLYREKQTGMLCGRHALNSVMCNMHWIKKGPPPVDGQCLVAWTDKDLKDFSKDPIHPGGYEVGLMLAVLQQELPQIMQDAYYGGGVQVTSPMKFHSISWYLSEFRNHTGKVLEYHIENLDWIICNTGGHWVTFFHLQGPWGNFCDLNSQFAHQAATQVTAEELLAKECTGILVPGQFGSLPAKPQKEQHPPEPTATDKKEKGVVTEVATEKKKTEEASKEKKKTDEAKKKKEQEGGPTTTPPSTTTTTTMTTTTTTTTTTVTATAAPHHHGAAPVRGLGPLEVAMVVIIGTVAMLFAGVGIAAYVRNAT